jgi:hypothetical protein
MQKNNDCLWRVWFVFVAGPVMTGVALAQAREAVRVVRTEPANNQEDVAPDLDRIVVKFSSAMKTDSFSVVPAGEGETPEVIGSPEFTDERTCVIKVRLGRGHMYSIGFNSETRKGFQSKNGVPAEPFVLTFRKKIHRRSRRGPKGPEALPGRRIACRHGHKEAKDFGRQENGCLQGLC